jgi:hypothetical protein
MKKIYSGRIFADHYQFYIFDSKENYFEDMQDWNEENSKQGYISNGRTIYLGTKAHLNDHWLNVYLSESTPSFDDCDRALSLNIQISSGVLGIATTLDEVARITLNKGAYISYILGFNLGVDQDSLEDMNEEPLSDEELEKRADLERYSIVLVPGTTVSEGVIKGNKYLY